MQAPAKIGLSVLLALVLGGASWLAMSPARLSAVQSKLATVFSRSVDANPCVEDRPIIYDHAGLRIEYPKCYKLEIRDGMVFLTLPGSDTGYIYISAYSEEFDQDVADYAGWKFEERSGWKVREACYPHHYGMLLCETDMYGAGWHIQIDGWQPMRFAGTEIEIRNRNVWQQLAKRIRELNTRARDSGDSDGVGDGPIATP